MPIFPASDDTVRQLQHCLHVSSSIQSLIANNFRVRPSVLPSYKSIYV